jgi:V8-like Glu-specific endopeptidase
LPKQINSIKTYLFQRIKMSLENKSICMNLLHDNTPFPTGQFNIDEKMKTKCQYEQKQMNNLIFDKGIQANLKNLVEKAVRQSSSYSKKTKTYAKYVRDAYSPDRNLLFPFSAIVSLDVFYENGEYNCGTGFMIGSKYLLTAANVICKQKKIAKTIYASPGRDRNSFPFGIHLVTHAFLFDENFETKPENDLAVLALKEDIGKYTGWFGLMELNYSELTRTEALEDDNIYDNLPNLNITGYDSPKYYRKRNNILKYDIDIVQGQSGSPIWTPYGFNFYAIGIHNQYGSSQSLNAGAKLTKEKITIISQVISGKFIETLAFP